MATIPISSGNIPLDLPKTSGAEVAEASQGFGNLLRSTIAEVNKAEHNGDSAIQKLHTGEAKNLHEVMIATEEADIAVRMLVQMRNKALEAYKEIMRLQV